MEKSNLKWEELENKIMETSNEKETKIDIDKDEKVYEDKKVKEDEKTDEIEQEKKSKSKKNIILPIIIVSIIIIIALIFSTIFAIININNDNIVSGIRIEGIDVSGLSRDDAKSKIELVYSEKKEKDIILKYQEYDATINPELLEANYEIEKAIEEAISIGKDSNIIVNNYNILFALMGKKDINVNMTINEEIAKKTVEDIGANIPGAVVEPDYYVEDDKLIITKGKEGLKIDTENLIEKIKVNFENALSNEQHIEIPVISKTPEKINIEKIHEEVCKEVQDAYYTKDPFTIHPEVKGIDFDLEEAKKILEEDKEQYEITLTITEPKVTTSQIGSEAFPDLVGTFTTRYDASLKNRSTNLEIACKKINDKVVMPGETFSYNKTLGERTAAAGYKNAAVYENGRVVDGIGGGICQISSTLYNAVIKANLGIVERRNHQFVTSYVPAGQDATVVYGMTDFKFKNTRNYAVKIKATCSNGIATVSIYGIKEENEYDIKFDTRIISTIPYTVKYEEDKNLAVGKEKVSQVGANGVITETYLVKSLNGKVVSREFLYKDTYNAMQRIIVRGTKGATTNTNNNANSSNNNNNVNTNNNSNTNNNNTENNKPEKKPEETKPPVEEKPEENKQTENTNNNRSENETEENE